MTETTLRALHVLPTLSLYESSASANQLYRPTIQMRNLRQAKLNDFPRPWSYKVAELPCNPRQSGFTNYMFFFSDLKTQSVPVSHSMKENIYILRLPFHPQNNVFHKVDSTFGLTIRIPSGYGTTPSPKVMLAPLWSEMPGVSTNRQEER